MFEDPNAPNLKGGEDQAHRPGGNIDLNHASKEHLMEVADIDRKTAADLLHYRDQHGGIQSWDDFNSAPIPQEALEKLRPHVRF